MNQERCRKIFWYSFLDFHQGIDNLENHQVTINIIAYFNIMMKPHIYYK